MVVIQTEFVIIRDSIIITGNIQHLKCKLHVELRLLIILISIYYVGADFAQFLWNCDETFCILNA